MNTRILNIIDNFFNVKDQVKDAIIAEFIKFIKENGTIHIPHNLSVAINMEYVEISYIWLDETEHLRLKATDCQNETFEENDTDYYFYDVDTMEDYLYLFDLIRYEL